MRAAVTAGSGSDGVLRRRQWAWMRTAVGEDGGVRREGSFRWWRQEEWVWRSLFSYADPVTSPPPRPPTHVCGSAGCSNERGEDQIGSSGLWFLGLGFRFLDFFFRFFFHGWMAFVLAFKNLIFTCGWFIHM